MTVAPDTIHRSTGWFRQDDGLAMRYRCGASVDGAEGVIVQLEVKFDSPEHNTPIFFLYLTPAFNFLFGDLLLVFHTASNSASAEFIPVHAQSPPDDRTFLKVAKPSDAEEMLRILCLGEEIIFFIKDNEGNSLRFRLPNDEFFPLLYSEIRDVRTTLHMEVSHEAFVNSEGNNDERIQESREKEYDSGPQLPAADKQSSYRAAQFGENFGMSRLSEEKERISTVTAPPAPKKDIALDTKRFRVGDLVEHPDHGIGRIKNCKEESVTGAVLPHFVIEFEKTKVVLRVPIRKVAALGMRKLSIIETPDNDKVQHVEMVERDQRQKEPAPTTNGLGICRNDS